MAGARSSRGCRAIRRAHTLARFFLPAVLLLSSCRRQPPTAAVIGGGAGGKGPAAAAPLAASETAAWWIEKFGVLAESDPRSVRVRSVFDRVSAASEHRSSRLPRLILLDADGSPMAMALRDGAILLTRGAVDFCYRGQSTEAGDSRLAFVLGHELSHLSEDHFGHALAFSAISRAPIEDASRGRLARWLRPTSEDQARIELDADRAGILAMTFAGFSPWEVVAEESPFIGDWVSQTGRREAFAGDSSHPSPEDRTAYLQSQLSEVAQSIPLFHFGTRLLEVGRLEDGLLLLARFAEGFPGREVLSNLGVGHARLALRALGRCDGALISRLRLPLLLDQQTLAERTIRRGASSPCYEREDVRRESLHAITFLERAAESDPTYAPAEINLIAAFVLFDQPARAVARAQDAVERFGDDLDVRTVAAVALYSYGERSGIDTADRALEELERVLERDPHHATALFDRAAILQERSRSVAAQAAWRRFLDSEPTGAWAETAHAWLGEARAPATARPALPAAYDKVGALGRGPLPELAASGRRARFEIGDLLVETVTGPFGSVYRLGNSTEMIETPLSPEQVDDLRRALGEPLDSQRTRERALWRYPDCALEVTAERARLIRFAPSRPAY